MVFVFSKIDSSSRLRGTNNIQHAAFGNDATQSDTIIMNDFVCKLVLPIVTAITILMVGTKHKIALEIRSPKVNSTFQVPNFQGRAIKLKQNFFFKQMIFIHSHQ